MKSWYKIALETQQDIPFLKDIPVNEAPLDPQTATTIRELQAIIEESNPQNIDEFISYLERFGSNFRFERFDFPNGPIVVIYDTKKEQWGREKVSAYVVDDFTMPEFEDALQWVEKLYDHELESYIPTGDFNTTFWEDAGRGFVLYHATQPEYVDSILKKGLKVMDKTRGLSNRGTGSAVFASTDVDAIQSYGSAVFEINISQMKQDGHMPQVSQEEPISEALQRKQLADMIGIEEYYPEENYASEGLYESTFIIYDNIPPKYLRLLE